MGRKIVAAPVVSLVSAKFMILAFILLAIGAAVLLTNGVLPHSTLTDPGETGELEVVLETPAPGEKGLQLRTIKFRECSQKAAIGLLLDRSGSMSGAKMTNLKSALMTLGSLMGSESVIGVESFSSNNYDTVRGIQPIVVTEDVPYGKYKDQKTTYSAAVTRLVASGGTNTRTAFEFTKNKILAAAKAYPDKTFSLIFVSDGIPESSQEPLTCPSGRKFGDRCFALSEDPTVSPNSAIEIKEAGIKIYAIALYNPSDPADLYFLPDMQNMMRQIATSPDTTYYETSNPVEITSIYKDIATKICQDIL